MWFLVVHTLHTLHRPLLSWFSQFRPRSGPDLLCGVLPGRHNLAMHHATGFKTAGDSGVWDLQFLLSEWDFYEAAAISLAYRVLKIFMADWDSLEAPSWNVMEFPIRECPQESRRAWFPGTRRCQRAGFMESNFLSKEKICSRDRATSAQRRYHPGFNGLPQQPVPGDCKDKWVLPALAARKLLYCFFKTHI